LTPPNQVNELGLVFVVDLKVNMDIFVNIVSRKSRDFTDSLFFLVFQRLKRKSIDWTDPKRYWDKLFGNTKIVWKSIEHNLWPPRICNPTMFNNLVR
jgi:hypothetical protein